MARSSHNLKMEDSPTLKGPGPTLYVSEKSGSKKSWLLKCSNRNIFIFIMIRIQEGPKTMDPKTPKTHFQQTLAVAGKNGPYDINNMR